MGTTDHEQPAPSAVKVIAIAGSARSGSTILDGILGSFDGGFSAGEVRWLWQRGLIERRLCGCSSPLPDCELWTRILARAFPAGVDVAEVAAASGRLRLRYAPLARIRALHGIYDRMLTPLADVVGPLYQTISRETDANFIVDSSKLSTYLYILSKNPSIDLRVVHLVRDPRAAVYSAGRTKAQLDTTIARPMRPTSPGRAAVDWVAFNGLTRSLFGSNSDRYLLLRYEDLVAQPASSVRDILAMADVPEVANAAIEGNRVVLQENHTVSGNPSRFVTGPVDLVLDDAWRSEMPKKTRRMVDRITAPYRGAFGYE
ncbi:MAG: sulfotransferase [bacterium]|nr:sulfotransferase [bacterium]